MPYCFRRSSVKFQGHTAKKNRRFWPKLGVSRLKNRRFESNLSKITRPVAAIKSLRFALFVRSSIKFQGHTGLKIKHLNPIKGKITRPATAIRSLRVALLYWKQKFACWWWPVLGQASYYPLILVKSLQFLEDQVPDLRWVAWINEWVQLNSLRNGHQRSMPLEILRF